MNQEVRAAAVGLADPAGQAAGQANDMMEDYCRSRGMEEILHSRKTAALLEQLGYTRTPGEFIRSTIPHCEMQKDIIKLKSLRKIKIHSFLR